MCLSLIQVGGKANGAADAAPSPARCARGRRDKHTPRKPNPTEIRKNRSRTGAASPLNRSAIAARIPFLHFPFLSRICTFGSQFAFGICRITSLLTAPMSTPSSQHRKSSYRSSFLSSSPNGQTISSSIMSEIKNCGRPLE